LLTCSNLVNFNLKAYNCIDVEALIYSFPKFFDFHPYTCIFLFTHIYVKTLTPLLEEKCSYRSSCQQWCLGHENESVQIKGYTVVLKWIL
jgi:hypothetical protein